MDSAYQPTTERTTSVSEDVTCSLGSIWPRSRRRDDVEVEEDQGDDDELAKPKAKRSLKTKNAGYRWLFCKQIRGFVSRADSCWNEIANDTYWVLWVRFEDNLEVVGRLEVCIYNGNRVGDFWSLLSKQNRFLSPQKCCCMYFSSWLEHKSLLLTDYKQFFKQQF